MGNLRCFFILTLALLAPPAAARAATITFGDISAAWQPLTPNNTLTTNGAAASWGDTRYNSQQSGYVFTAASSPQTADVPAGGSAAFSLGSLTHINEYTVGADAIGLRLMLSIDIYIDGESAGRQDFAFDFFQTETVNNPYLAGATSCANGARVGAGVNVNGCADLNTLDSSLPNSFVFDTDGKSYEYTLDLNGFNVNGQLLDEFWTPEWESTTAGLEASLTAREAGPSLPSTVPEPASLLLCGTGFGIMGLAAWRRQSQVRK